MNAVAFGWFLFKKSDAFKCVNQCQKGSKLSVGALCIRLKSDKA